MGLPPLAAIVIGGLLVVTVPLVARAFIAPTETDEQGVQALIVHQTEGLANPFDPRSSTGTVHLDLVRDGLVYSLHHPLGGGLAVVTNAGSRLGEAQLESRNTEVDVSNAAVAMGIPGLVAYLVIFGLGLMRAYRAARSSDPLALACLGVLVATLFQWLNGGQYAVALLPWLILGFLDRPGESLSHAKHDAKPTAEVAERRMIR